MGREVEAVLARTFRLLRVRAYSERTQETYTRWIGRFLRATSSRSTEELVCADAERYLAHLAEHAHLAPRTRNQAASALAFLFREILGRDCTDSMPRAREPTRVPVVLSHREAMVVLRELSGKYRLLGSLMYGAGLRLTEAHQLRVMDIDFDLLQIAVRDGKGAKDRWVMLPSRLRDALRRQIGRVEAQHAADRGRGAGWAPLPHALARKDPRAGYELGWQFLFPATRQSRDPVTGRRGRYHLDPSATQREVKKAARKAPVKKPVTCHTFRRSFATQMLRTGYDVRTVQKLLGHRDLRTTMLYVDAVTSGGFRIRSPLDHLEETG